MLNFLSWDLSSFQEVNRLFVLSFEDNVHRTGYRQYFLPTVEINDYYVTTDEKKLSWSTGKNHRIIYDNVIKIVTGQGDDYTTGCCIMFISKINIKW